MRRPESTAEVAELRIAWAAMKEGKASDQQWLDLLRQDDAVLDLLKSDYDNKTSPYGQYPVQQKAARDFYGTYILPWKAEVFRMLVFRDTR